MYEYTLGWSEAKLLAKLRQRWTAGIYLRLHLDQANAPAVPLEPSHHRVLVADPILSERARKRVEYPVPDVMWCPFVFCARIAEPDHDPSARRVGRKLTS